MLEKLLKATFFKLGLIKMVKITKVYTRLGDQGETHLAAGLRVKKSSLRIKAIGEVDELNSFLGWSIQVLKTETNLQALLLLMRQIQQELFNLGSQLAVLPSYRRANTPIIQMKDIERLEQEIDQYNEELSNLTSFILPGGGEVSTRLHITRSVCRRAEREILSLAEAEPLEETIIVYLNRLSDWLFVMARYVALKMGESETLWQV